MLYLYGNIRFILIVYAKYFQSIDSSTNVNSQRKRCLLCDALLKSHRYLLMGKSIQDMIMINNHQTITYAECCRKYLNEKNLFDKYNMICLKCCENLQNLHSLHLNTEDLSKKLRQKFRKTKRLNQIRQTNLNRNKTIDIKEESSPIEIVSESINPNESFIHKHVPSYDSPSHVNSLWIIISFIYN